MARRAKLLTLVGVVALLMLPLKALRAQSNQEIAERGIQAMKVRKFTTAEREFSLLVQRDPSPMSYSYLALAEAAAGKLGQAIVDFKKSIQLGANSAGVFYNLGFAYFQDRQTQAAIQAFQRAVSVDPHYVPARYALGLAFLRAGRARDAIGALDEARRQSPQDPRAWAALARAQFEAGDAERAVRTAQQATQAVPNSPQLAVTLASLCLKYQKTQVARNLLEEANELMPGDAEVQMLLAKVSLAAGEPVEALAVLRAMPSEGKENPEKLFLTGEARALTGNLNAAAEELAIALKDSPGNARYTMTYAWVQQLQGRYRDAIATLTQAGALDRKTPQIPYRMCVSYYFMNQYSQAERFCRESLERDPKYSAAYLLLGTIKLKQKDFAAAQSELQSAVRLNPGNPLFHRELGEALYEAGNAAQGEKQLDLAIGLDPKDAESYFWRSMALARQGAKQRAIADLNTAVALRPGYADAYTALARLYTAAGEPQQAAKVLAEGQRIKSSAKTSETDQRLRMLQDSAP